MQMVRVSRIYMYRKRKKMSLYTFRIFGLSVRYRYREALCKACFGFREGLFKVGVSFNDSCIVLTVLGRVFNVC